MSSSLPQKKDQQPDRIDELVSYLTDASVTDLPDHLKTFKYADGWDPDKLEEQLQTHPFFMTKFPEGDEPVPPLLEAFQQLKYSEEENSPHELALNHKEDGMFHFKIRKYRIAATCFTTAMTHEGKSEQPDTTLTAVLYNNRAACSFYIKNYRSCIADCHKAVQLDPNYVKAIKRGIAASELLSRWDDLDKFIQYGETLCCCQQHEDDEVLKKFLLDKRKVLRKGVSSKLMEGRKREFQDGVIAQKHEAILAAVRSRGIRVNNEGFLESDAANEGKVVTLRNLDGGGGGDELSWPVLFMYPQYSQSDFIEQFSELNTFEEQLREMLEGEAPPWDKEREYRVHNVEVYYINQGFVSVPLHSTLLDVMKRQNYAVPSNGVPSFFVLAKDNQFCHMFKERVDMEQ